MSVLRSLLFYIVFYLGSIYHVAGSALLVTLGSRRTFRRVVEDWSRWHRWCARVLLGIDQRIEGTIPSGQVLVALKHESFYEAIDLPAMFDRPSVFAKAELMRLPLWGFAADRYGLVAVEREQGAKALRAMLNAAKKYSADGRPLLIFPEGTRVPHGQRAELQSGFAGLYKLLGLPVVACAIDSGPLYHRRWKRPGTVTFRFSEPIPPGLPREEIEQRVQDAINALNAPAPNPSGPA
ncbi:lysophospholipid acyltransferase family protein [Novosphingobium arvoryzae]|uniref:1-acyl-sn-glycerol-3-phosphate acyltransferase n=1 Tax=Novosphingobium arvoryzae TaxID=1256514 RepID=A0A918RJX7_9SPHN|nr:lysophospholipid acyltransferase family protein [Novosphingobium arvoryzae]GHA01874.1 1-acyl-sn-glycerol-3-phosphate acyltransferase [Novosphingobium arvoryzae]